MGTPYDIPELDKNEKEEDEQPTSQALTSEAFEKKSSKSMTLFELFLFFQMGFQNRFANQLPRALSQAIKEPLS